MDEQLIKSILSIKEQAVRSLVRLTESPIEEKFLLEFIKYIERSLMNQSPYDVGPQTEIDGYTRSEERRVGKECRSRWSRYL